MILQNINELRVEGRTGVLVGLYDGITPETLRLISAAKKLVDHLLVLVQKDYWCKRTGKDPHYTDEQRAGMLSSVRDVDYVYVYDSASPVQAIRRFKIDLCIKPLREAAGTHHEEEACTVVFVKV